MRGLAVILMCFDHFMCDLMLLPIWFPNFYAEASPSLIQASLTAEAYWNGSLRFWGHLIFAGLFIFICGISTSFSRDNLTRTAQLIFVSELFTLVTFCISKFMPFDTIVFGILHLLAFSLILYCAIDNVTKNPYVYLVIGVIIVSIGIGFEYWEGIPYDDEFHLNNLGSYMLGFMVRGEDWFGIIPNTGIFFMGVYFGKVVYPTRQTLLPIKAAWSKPFNFVGRHSLIIYILHQILIAGIVALIAIASGCTLA